MTVVVVVEVLAEDVEDGGFVKDEVMGMFWVVGVAIQVIREASVLGKVAVFCCWS